MKTRTRSERRHLVQLPALGGTALLLIIAAGFFILHIVGAIDLPSQSSSMDNVPPPGATHATFD